MDKIKLFCFPWAGGSALSFYKWRKNLDEWIELIPVELSGRGHRHASPLYSTFEDAVEDVYIQIKNNLDGSPYAFFGHSMGSLIAFELSHKIKGMGKSEPQYLFMSGRWAPNIIKKNPIDFCMSDEEMKIAMERLGGTGKDLLEDEKLMKVFIPVLRSDIRITEEYDYIEKNEKLNSNIVAMTGISDSSIHYSDLLAWQQHTECEFNICKFKGGHFFINEVMENVVKYINSRLIDIKYKQQINL